jgi:PadR family transcriptional regulator PadR
MDHERRAQWLRGVLDLCVLAILGHGESYGYQISQDLKTAGFGPVQGGTLYPVLLRLEKSGLVTADWRHGGSGPARKYYRISAEGKKTLAVAAGEWRRFAGSVSNVLREV